MKSIKNNKRLIFLGYIFILIFLATIIGVLQGKDLNWDQTNYHIYIAHALSEKRLFKDFFAANIQSYLNPLAHLPFYWLAKGNLPTAIGTAILSVLHSINIVLVYIMCCLVLAEQQKKYLIAFILTIFSVSAPVILAELGSSLIEMVASIPIMLGLTLLIKLAKNPTYKLYTTLSTAYFLMGMGAALKLPFIIFVISSFVYIILLAPTKNKILNLSIVAGFSVLLGILLGGGWHYWQVWCEFGNPFYPFFNQIWHSPSYPAEALVNDRFVRKTPLEWLLLPLQMLLPYDFITIEKMNVDPRYLIIGVLTIIVILIFMIQLITRQYLEKNNISVGEKKHIITFMIYFWFSYILWCVTSGNGRYGVPLHLSIGALVAFLYISLAIKNNKKYLIILFATIISVFTSILTWKESHWNRVQHTDKWYNFVISPQSKISSATYVSVGYMDRTSYSYLIPFLPSDARFISINGYANLNATEFAGKQALGVLKKYKNYPVMLIAEPRKRELAEIPAEYWMKNINLNLKQFGLQITSEKNCQPVINGFNQRIVAEICFLNHVAEDNSAQKSQIDNFYDRLEQVNAKLLRPTIDKSYYRNGNYCRFYTATEIYVCTDDTNIWWMRVAPVSLQMIGKVSEVLMTHPPKLNEL